MPTNKDQQQIANESAGKRELKANSLRHTRKAPGTRVGTIQDWRAANSSSGNLSGRHGNSIRDGR
ncbi:MAG TPA: hypothetical protein VGQ41_06470 [Pyrinomonadaceae bacterium]|jgi:hypothetical protein|nr:hypothetical protein [Pyrinomonadaceae bacterium]